MLSANNLRGVEHLFQTPDIDSDFVEVISKLLNAKINFLVHILNSEPSFSNDIVDLYQGICASINLLGVYGFVEKYKELDNEFISQLNNVQGLNKKLKKAEEEVRKESQIIMSTPGLEGHPNYSNKRNLFSSPADLYIHASVILGNLLLKREATSHELEQCIEEISLLLSSQTEINTDDSEQVKIVKYLEDLLENLSIKYRDSLTPLWLTTELRDLVSGSRFFNFVFEDGKFFLDITDEGKELINSLDSIPQVSKENFINYCTELRTGFNQRSLNARIALLQDVNAKTKDIELKSLLNILLIFFNLKLEFIKQGHFSAIKQEP